MHLTQLGITDMAAWRYVTSFRNGLVLIAGSACSGKTTTLHATARQLRGSGKCISGFPGAIDWPPPYLRRVQMCSRAPLDFAAGIKAFMRADPDVVIVDEIGDPIAAKKALQAAESGHVVIATINALSGQLALHRLLALGVELEDLEMLLRGVLFQLLVRALCRTCGGTGCELCGGDGYGGQTAVSAIAVVRMPADVGRMVGPGHDDINWNALQQDLEAKVRSGVTDLREMHRCFPAEIQLSGAPRRIFGPSLPFALRAQP